MIKNPTFSERMKQRLLIDNKFNIQGIQYMISKKELIEIIKNKKMSLLKDLSSLKNKKKETIKYINYREYKNSLSIKINMLEQQYESLLKFNSKNINTIIEDYNLLVERGNIDIQEIKYLPMYPLSLEAFFLGKDKLILV